MRCKEHMIFLARKTRDAFSTRIMRTVLGITYQRRYLLSRQLFLIILTQGSDYHRSGSFVTPIGFAKEDLSVG